MYDVRDNISSVIRDRACNLSEIARRADITPVKLSLVLAKKRKLEANELCKLCTVLNVSLKELRDYNTPNNNEQTRKG